VELWLGSRTRGWNICRHRPAHTHTRDREPSDMVGRKRVSPTCHWGTDGRTGRGGPRRRLASPAGSTTETGARPTRTRGRAPCLLLHELRAHFNAAPFRFYPPWVPLTGVVNKGPQKPSITVFTTILRSGFLCPAF
jgi:hypothetical protein